MTEKEWRELYNIDDESFERIDFCWKYFGGKIVEPKNPPLDYEVVKYTMIKQSLHFQYFNGTIRYTRKETLMRNKLYSERIEVCLTPDQKKLLERKAAFLQLTLNQFIREAIGRMIKER